MREASFTLPTVDAFGHTIEWLHEEMVTVLVLRYGSAEMTDVLVATTDQRLVLTPARRYRVTLAEDRDDAALLDLAAQYARRAAQAKLHYVSRHGRAMTINLNDEGKAA